MNLYLSHTTALTYWLLGHGRNSESILKRKRVVLLPPASPPRITNDEALFLQETLKLPAPFHAAVADRTSHRTSRSLIVHVCANASPACSYVEVAEGLYVACPELALLQSANMVSKHNLIKAGFDLCSTYQRNYFDGVTQYGVEPLTSVKCINDVIRGCAKMHGVKKMASIVRHLRDGSASPQETLHALLLGLPFPLGGAGLGVPQMNHRIALTPEAKKIAGAQTLVCDLFWPKWKYDVEYESYEFHASKDRLISDSTRREALALMGVTVLTVTAAQTKTASDIDILAKSIATGMHRYLRPRKDYSKQRKELLRVLQSDAPLA